jgi:LmbE family N-acetylglucosaminyl deacetylase
VPTEGAVAGVPRRALAIYAHPDDADVACGGTLAGWSAGGCDVQLCICCQGDKGSVDPAAGTADLVAQRRQEVEAAGAVLRISAHHWLGYRDGEVDDGLEIRERLVGLVRAVRPEVVLAPDPTAVFFGPNYVNHRDHRAVGWAVLDAVSPAAASPHYFPAAGPAFQVNELYLSGTLEPDVWVDISSWIADKAAALACHVSQIGDGGEWLRRVVQERAEEAGQGAGVPYAEAFRRVVLG